MTRKKDEGKEQKKKEFDVIWVSEWHTSTVYQYRSRLRLKGLLGGECVGWCDGRQCAGFDSISVMRSDLMVLVLQLTSNGDVYFFCQGVSFSFDWLT